MIPRVVVSRESGGNAFPPRLEVELSGLARCVYVPEADPNLIEAAEAVLSSMGSNPKRGYAEVGVKAIERLRACLPSEEDRDA